MMFSPAILLSRSEAFPDPVAQTAAHAEGGSHTKKG
jgi:hypothetical protein